MPRSFGARRRHRPVLDHADLIAGRVEADLVHERADQQESAPADPRQVFRLDRAVEERCIKARPVVANDEPGRIAVELHLHADPPRAVRLQALAFFGQIVELPLVLLPQLGADLEVAMEQGIGQRLLKRDADLHPASRIAQAHPLELLLDQGHQGHDQIWVALEQEGRLAADQTTEDPLPFARQGGHVQNATERGRQVASQVSLGDVVGRAGAEGPHGDLLAAEGGHQDHGDLGMLGPHALDQLQALDLGHDQVRQDDRRGLARGPQGPRGRYRRRPPSRGPEFPATGRPGGGRRRNHRRPGPSPPHPRSVPVGNRTSHRSRKQWRS